MMSPQPPDRRHANEFSPSTMHIEDSHMALLQTCREFDIAVAYSPLAQGVLQDDTNAATVWSLLMPDSGCRVSRTKIF